MRKAWLVVLSILLILSSMGRGQAKEEERSNRVFLPVVGVTRYVGAQDEGNGVWEGRYLSGQITKVTLRWDLIEKNRGSYNWNAEGDDAALKVVGGKYRLLIGTRGSPKWARKYAEYPCSQPKPEFYDEYANFVKAAAERYKAWGVELWNEPDVKRGEFGKDWVLMGCWDTGKQYSEMTQVVYPRIKRADLVVMVGAMMLEETSWAANMLAWEPAGDWISYHSYAYNGVVKEYEKPREKADWIHARTDKGVFLSEVALLDYTEKCSGAYQNAKADYLDMLNESLVSWGIEGFTWYTIGGNNWKCSDLYPGPAYETYKSLFGGKQ